MEENSPNKKKAVVPAAAATQEELPINKVQPDPSKTEDEPIIE